MSEITIHACVTRVTLFQGNYPSMRHCAEAAVRAGISLAGADFLNADLSNASLDGANLRGANLNDCIMHGINLSEADLSGASAMGADLTAACLCDARLACVNFADATFGGTLITGARIEACVFSCPTFLTLPFTEARLGHNVYMHDNCQPMNFSVAPVVITGLPKRLAFFDTQALIGHRIVPCLERPVQQFQDFCAKYG